ncbi:hypothetical protein VFPPC_17407 [Pochonia chlamydosporia 170]|uniref:Uncharacterized protein n=1 Tax=Pochonia chlamydosporia 170 TaxID=1380566 RepID=A0A219AT23_METCM|nr:hypothetical protein VFPPC_17407 [Pochonia chlamydosporia 170]OWT43444.1 hypothetical protein VFPPC_17407 [Pochonia chlamydosporia 170]
MTAAKSLECFFFTEGRQTMKPTMRTGEDERVAARKTRNYPEQSNPEKASAKRWQLLRSVCKEQKQGLNNGKEREEEKNAHGGERVWKQFRERMCNQVMVASSIVKERQGKARAKGMTR